MHVVAIPPPNPREFSKTSHHLKSEGAGKCRGRAAPAVSCATCTKETHTSIQVQRRHPGIPCAMVLRLITRSPRRRIPFATVIRGLKVLQNPVGPANLRGLDTSNGCQNHTPSPPASAPFAQRSIGYLTEL